MLLFFFPFLSSLRFRLASDFRLLSASLSVFFCNLSSNFCCCLMSFSCLGVNTCGTRQVGGGEGRGGRGLRDVSQKQKQELEEGAGKALQCVCGKVLEEKKMLNRNHYRKEEREEEEEKKRERAHSFPRSREGPHSGVSGSGLRLLVRRCRLRHGRRHLTLHLQLLLLLQSTLQSIVHISHLCSGTVRHIHTVVNSNGRDTNTAVILLG